MTALTTGLHAAWTLFTSAALYFLLGLVVAGLMHAFVTREMIARWLGGRSLRSVLSGAIAGIPLPLCSCGVLPAAVALRQQGASKGATLAFLISTPETGVDSIAVTYALLGPLMAVIRPVAAFVSAFIAGAIETLFGQESPGDAPTAGASCCHAERTAGNPPLPPFVKGGGSVAIVRRLRSGMRYAFVELLADITPTFLLGVGLGGAIASLIPATFIEQYLGGGWRAMLAMLAVGIPLYICASASTPIAAALLMKGMSPGAALVFLLAGPATNITSIPVVAKMLGWRSVAFYLSTIAVCALAFGLLTDRLFASWLSGMVADHVHQHPISAAWQQIAAGVLLLCMGIATLCDRRSQKSPSPAKAH